MLQQNVTIKVDWAQPGQTNSLDLLYVNGKMVLHRPSYRKLVKELRLDAVIWDSTREAMAFGICKTLYGEDIAFQIFQLFADTFSKHYYIRGSGEVTLDLKGFNDYYLSNIQYYDVDVDVRWRYFALTASGGTTATYAREKLNTISFHLSNVPVVNLNPTEISEEETLQILQRHAEHKCSAEIMAHDFVAEVQTYTLSPTSVEKEEEAYA